MDQLPQSGSPLLSPLSQSTFTSPPPLSSAGLSSRIQATHPRFSTILPNSSGYLSFLSRPRPTANTSSIPLESKHRSNAFFSNIRNVSSQLCKSFSTSRDKKRNISRRFSPPQEYIKSQSQQAEQNDAPRRKEWRDVELDWKSQAKSLNDGYIQCLNAARCVSINDPTKGVRNNDDGSQPTIIISSSDDPSSPLHTSSSNLLKSNQTHPDEIALVSTSPLGENTLEQQDEEEPIRFMDFRAGTANSSTKRVPTQKSVHPALFNQSTGDGRRNKSGNDDFPLTESEDEVSRMKQDDSLQECKCECECDEIHSFHYALNQTENHIEYSRTNDRDTQSTDSNWSLLTNVDGESTPRCQIIRPSFRSESEISNEDTSILASIRHSSTLDTNEYGCLLSFPNSDTKNVGTPCMPSTPLSSTYRSSRNINPFVHTNGTLDNDTPIYSPQSTVDATPTALSMNIISSDGDTSALTSASTEDMTRSAGRNIHREHMRRVVVQKYNESPSPTSSMPGDMLASTPENHAHPKRGEKKGLRRALGKGNWYRQQTR
ncbi:uncharacterized protein IL334_000179 [Kwoniella shivajii]|uniref:Uncharacterized protein n=1 Tax=Kwoniella shivajii TaxID=564305 RepID=A0ABZ1CRG7_9TREE|nr:hypothetical protein IL334_000179 [Kwoniella shivajii]